MYYARLYININTYFTAIVVNKTHTSPPRKFIQLFLQLAVKRKTELHRQL